MMLINEVGLDFGKGYIYIYKVSIKSVYNWFESYIFHAGKVSVFSAVNDNRPLISSSAFSMNLLNSSIP